MSDALTDIARGGRINNILQDLCKEIDLPAYKGEITPEEASKRWENKIPELPRYRGYWGENAQSTAKFMAKFWQGQIGKHIPDMQNDFLKLLNDPALFLFWVDGKGL